MNERKLTLTSS